MKALLERLLEREDLAQREAHDLLVALTAPDFPPALAGALLAALRAKGVSAEELRGFASALRERARRPQLPPGPPAIDIVGTGGDRSGSLNLSTGAALLTAAAGQRVIKHGNRSVSSRAGAADVLEQLGLQLPLDEAAAGRCLAATGFTFLFAPYYHPAMKNIGPVRQALGVRTVFNILGPLSNPAEPAFHLIGAYSSATAALLANALAGLPLERAFVVHGADGWDEPTPVGPFEIYDVRPGRVQRATRTPEDYRLARCRSAELIGGDAAHNAAALRAALGGAEHGPHRDALLLGAALALEVCGQVDGPAAGMARAAAAIDGGAAARLLDNLGRFGRGGAA
jgi:anthranilate phosphoribosyltransferase